MVHLFRVSLAWHTFGFYHCAVSAFLEPHHLHKASDHPVISKLICYFYLQQPPSCKSFDPRDVECLLSLFESWAPNSSLIAFKLVCKTGALLALVTAKCSDVTLLCIDNQHLFLQHHAAVFIPISGGKTDQPGHLPPQIHIESYSSVNICAVFYLKAFLRHTKPFRKKPDGLHVTSLVLGISRQYRLVCGKTILSWISKVFCVAKAYMSLCYPLVTCH